jgi:hypothetical protein
MNQAQGLKILAMTWGHKKIVVRIIIEHFFAGDAPDDNVMQRPRRIDARFA